MEAQFSTDTCERTRVGEETGQGSLGLGCRPDDASVGNQQWLWSKGCLLQKSHFEPNGQDPIMPLGFSLSLGLLRASQVAQW